MSSRDLFDLEPGDTGEALLVPKANAEGVHADRDGSEAPRGGVPSTGQPETRGAGDTVPTDERQHRLQRLWALSESDFRRIPFFLAGYAPEAVDRALAHVEGA